MSDELMLENLFGDTENTPTSKVVEDANDLPIEVIDDVTPEEKTTEVAAPVVASSEAEDRALTSDKESTKTTDKKKEDKLVDKELNIDYSYILDKDRTDTLVITEEDIAQEDTDLLKTFLELNSDIKCYIDKSLFDPTAKVAKHIINLLKDKNYKVTVNGKEYRLPEVIMLKAMSNSYNYVCAVAKELAKKNGNSSCIQLDDDDVYTIAENYFKHTKSDITFSNSSTVSKSANSTKKAEKKKTDKKTVASTKKEEPKSSAQMSLNDFFV